MSDDWFWLLEDILELMMILGQVGGGCKEREEPLKTWTFFWHASAEIGVLRVCDTEWQHLIYNGPTTAA